MRPRLPYSARKLQAEVSEIDEDATFEAVSIDGLGTYRALIITTGDPLGVAEAISRVRAIDRRITSVDMDEDQVLVRFPGDRIVESHARFGLRDIYEALREEAQSTEAEQEILSKAAKSPTVKKTHTRKTAAKKAAPKNQKEEHE